MTTERIVCQGSADITPPTFTAQHKGVFMDAVGNLRFFTRPEMRVAQETWRASLAAMRRQFSAPVKGPVRIHVELDWPFPKATPKWIRAFRFAPKTTKPDLDNVLKGMLDVMTAMQFWEDDAQIAVIEASKRLADRGRVSVRVSELVVNSSRHVGREENSLPLAFS